MDYRAPRLNEWRRLYGIAQQIRDLEPWIWLEETDMFGVSNPENEELGFVSIMGSIGQHFAIGVFLGARAFHGLRDLQSDECVLSFESLLETPQLQASFENPVMLQPRDLETIKRLGLRFFGYKAWPLFRSYRPGYFPWFLESDEARFLIHALEQTRDIALRARDDPRILRPPGSGDLLVRESRRTGKKLVWADQVSHIARPDPLPIPSLPLKKHLERLGSCDRGGTLVEIDLFLLPTPIGGENDRPMVPYVLMIVDGVGGRVLAAEAVCIETSLESMWSRIPGKVVDEFTKAGTVPGEIRVRTELLFGLLRPLADRLDVVLRESVNLPRLDPAKEHFPRRFDIARETGRVPEEDEPGVGF